MIRFCLALFAVVVIASCKDETPTASREVSQSGIANTLITLPGNEDISIQVAWGADWPYSEGRNQAVPYIGAELILAGGAAGFAPGEAAERFADIDAEGYLNATIDHVYGELTFPVADMDEAISVANAHLAEPTFEESWFNRIRD